MRASAIRSVGGVCRAHRFFGESGVTCRVLRPPGGGKQHKNEGKWASGIYSCAFFLKGMGGDQERGQDKQAADEQQEHVGMLSEQKQGSQSRQGNFKIVHNRQLHGSDPPGAVIPEEKTDS